MTEYSVQNKEIKKVLTKILFNDKISLNISKCVDEIMISLSCFQRIGGGCKPIHNDQSASFLSRVAEGLCWVGDHGCPVIMAKSLSELEKSDCVVQ